MSSPPSSPLSSLPSSPPKTPERTPTSGFSLKRPFTVSPGGEQSPDHQRLRHAGCTSNSEIVSNTSSLLAELQSDLLLRHSGPTLASKGTLESTRGPTNADYRLASDLQLKRITYDPTLLERLRGDFLDSLEAISLNMQDMNQMMSLSHLQRTRISKHLSPLIYSEMDSQDWVGSVLLRPALALVLATKTSTIVGPREEYPHIASAPNGDVIPDVVLYSAKDRAVLVAEFKSPGTLDICILPDIKETAAFSELLCGIHNHYSKGNQPDADGKVGSSSVINMDFNWPTRKEQGSVLQKDEKMLVQLWSQMCSKNVRFAILSSYVSTFFFYRHDNGVLYMSPQRILKEAPVLDTYLWMALALGHIPTKSLKLPEVKPKILPKDNEPVGFSRITWPGNYPYKRAVDDDSDSDETDPPPIEDSDYDPEDAEYTP